MAKISYSAEDVQRLTQAWIDSGLPITVWCAGEDDGEKRPNIQTFRKWAPVKAEIDARKAIRVASSHTTHSPNTMQTPKPSVSPLYAQFEEEYEANKQAAYVQWLQGNQEAIKQRALERLEADMARELEKLTGNAGGSNDAV